MGPCSAPAASPRRLAVFAAAAAIVSGLFTAQAVAAPTYASAVPAGGYVRGDVVFGLGANLYSNPAAALGPVQPLVGAGTEFQNLYNPFNPHFEDDQMVAVGRGGSLTLQFPAAVPVLGQAQIGVFTNSGLVDAAYPGGSTGAVTATFAGLEYGAERSAVVEVASTLGDFRPLGRVLFTAPGNYYANAMTNIRAVPPDAPVLADFGKPFTQPLSAFDGKGFTGVLATLDGSAGGTWITLPADLGLSEINYVRFSDPLWVLPDGSTAAVRTSAYDPAFSKPADLVIDAVAAVPEPATAAVLAVAGAVMVARRRRRSA